MQNDDLDTLKMVRDAIDGLSFGTDWNNGTHAKIYRPKLLATFPALDALIARMGADHIADSRNMVARMDQNGDASTSNGEAACVSAATIAASPASYAAGKSERHEDICPQHGRFIGTNCTYCDYPPIFSNTAPAAPDVDELVRKVEILATKAIVEVRELRDLIRAHFAGEKRHVDI